jgi:hypothetical protein
MGARRPIRCGRVKYQAVWWSLALMAGCGPSPLTRDQAAQLISKSLELSSPETLQLATPSGCFILARRADVRSADITRDPQLAALPYLRNTLDRERELGLVEFEFSETPADAPFPPQGCGQLWATQHADGTTRDAAARSKLIVWKTVPSDKAMAAGLQPGQTFLYLRRTLIAITRLDSKDGGTMVAAYQWRWAPSYEGEHLGIQPSEPFPGTARFRKVGGEWRMAR